MVKSIPIKIGKRKTRLYFIAGLTKRFGLGIAIERFGISFDFGPAWISIEW